MRRSLLVLGLVAALFWNPVPSAGAEPPDGTVVQQQVLPLDLGGDNEDAILAIADYPGGKVLVGGRTSTGVGTWTMFLARYLADGSLDPSFGAGGMKVNPFGCLYCEVTALEVLDDHQIIVGGTAAATSGSATFLIGKLQPSGNPSTSFGVSGSVQVDFGLGTTNELADLAILEPFGRIVAVGTTGIDQTDSEFAVVRLLPTGALDSTFGTGGKTVVGIDLSGQFQDFARAVALDSRYHTYVAGSTWNQNGATNAWSYNFAIIQLDFSGELVTCFGLGGRKPVHFDLGGTLNDHAFSIAISGQRLFVAGEAATGPGAGNKAWAVAQLFSSCGQLAGGFGTGGKATGTFAGAGSGERDFARAILPQGNGRVLIAGGGYESGVSRFGVARLDAEDGSFDPEFGGGDGRLLWDIPWGTGSGHDEATAAAFAAGRFLVGGKAEWSGTDTDGAWLLLSNSYVFADGFESDDTDAW